MRGRDDVYQSHFGMSRAPFRQSADPDRYFPARGHEAALAELRAAIEEGESLALLEAPPGMGKTLLGLLLVGSAAPHTRTVLLTNSHFDGPLSLTRSVLADLGEPTLDDPRQQFVDSSLRHFTEGGGTLVIVDEAQNLDESSLEELRMWGNLEGPTGRAVQVVLLALPSIARCLASERLDAFRQRLVVRTRLDGLSSEESVELLTRELRQSGVCPETVLTREAGEVIATTSAGVPRVLYQLAHRAFRTAAECEARQVDVECVLEAAGQLGLESQEPSPEVLPMPARDEATEEKQRTERPRRGGKRKTAGGES